MSVKLTDEERGSMIEWLYTCTGYSKQFWERCTDEQLISEYRDHAIVKVTNDGNH